MKSARAALLALSGEEHALQGGGEGALPRRTEQLRGSKVVHRTASQACQARSAGVTSLLGLLTVLFESAPAFAQGSLRQSTVSWRKQHSARSHNPLPKERESLQVQEKGGGGLSSPGPASVCFSLQDGRALEALDTLRADSELAGGPAEEISHCASCD